MELTVKRALNKEERRSYLEEVGSLIVSRLDEARASDQVNFVKFGATVCDRGLTIGASLPNEYNSMIFTMPLLTRANGFVRLVEQAHFAILGSEKYAAWAVGSAVSRVLAADANHGENAGLPEKTGRIALRERRELSNAVESRPVAPKHAKRM